MRSFIYRTMRQSRLAFWAPCALLILGLYQCGGSDPASPAGNGEPGVVAPDPTQRTALIALYEATDGANWTDNTNWLSDAPLDEWYGVTTDANGRVTRLSLYDNELSGSIPASLGDLTDLQRLSLSSNELSGSIPASLGDLTNLKDLGLGGNELSGSIPASLGDLTNLATPVSWPHPIIGFDSRLVGRPHQPEIRLSLPYNELSGSIPASLGNLTNLLSLSLGVNQLSGSIPASLGDLTNLQRPVALLGNRVIGFDSRLVGQPHQPRTTCLFTTTSYRARFPPSLGNLTNLQDLDLGDNELSGSIPPSLGDLTNLENGCVLHIQRVIGFDSRLVGQPHQPASSSVSSRQPVIGFDSRLVGQPHQPATPAS